MLISRYDNKIWRTQLRGTFRNVPPTSNNEVYNNMMDTSIEKKNVYIVAPLAHLARYIVVGRSNIQIEWLFSRLRL